MLLDVTLCRQTGWTLDVVRALDPDERQLLNTYWDALDKAQAHMQKQGSKKKG